MSASNPSNKFTMPRPSGWLFWIFFLLATVGHASPSRRPAAPVSKLRQELEPQQRQANLILRAFKLLPRSRARDGQIAKVRQLIKTLDTHVDRVRFLEDVGVMPLIEAIGDVTPPSLNVARDTAPKFSVIDPVMRAFTRLTRQNNLTQPFLGFDITCDLHGLGSNGAVLRSYVEGGADAQSINGILKRHSTFPPVAHELGRGGLTVTAATARPSEQYVRLATDLVERVRANPQRKFMVVGDGGRLLAMVALLMNLPENRDLAKRVVAVEQTRKGTIILENPSELDKIRAELPADVQDRLGEFTLPFPVVDMGRLWAKHVYESPMIGLSAAKVSDRHMQMLRELGFGRLPPATSQTTVMLWGLGNVGQAAIRSLLASGYRVVGYDKVLSKTLERKLRRLGVETFAEETTALHASPHVILYSTGQSPINERNIEHMADQTIVGNIASLGELDGLFANTQPAPVKEVKVQGQTISLTFSRGKWRRVNKHEGGKTRADMARLLQGELDIEALQKRYETTAGRHADFPVNEHQTDDFRPMVRIYRNKEFIVMRGGQVLNFGSADPIPPAYIQLTRGLLYLASRQATELVGAAPGLYDVAKPIQKAWVRRVQRDLKNMKLGPLLQPTF